MAFLFRNRSKPDLAKSAKELIPRVWEAPYSQKAEEDAAKVIAQIKLALQGTIENESSPDSAAALVVSIISEDLLLILARAIRQLPFVSRKDAQTILSAVFRWRPTSSISAEPPAVAYVIEERPEVIIELCRGYEHRESALACGMVLRDILRYENVVALILFNQSSKDEHVSKIHEIDFEASQTGEGIFWDFFPWIDKGAFEVSTDAFTTFREILTKHKQLVYEYLSTNFDLFFSRYNETLIKSNSYVAKRQSIKLLGELLLDRANYNIMTTYVDRGEHLKLCMNLLRDERKMVKYEGFHVFKVFVANPNKSIAVQRILINNRERLLDFLPKFLDDRTEDDQFLDEKSFLIRQIETMPLAPVDPTQG